MQTPVGTLARKPLRAARSVPAVVHPLRAGQPAGSGGRGGGTRFLLEQILLLGAYVVVGKLGLSLAFIHASASAVWPPTGMALVAVLALGYRVWPAIALGAFLVNVTTAGSVATSIGIAAGNTLEALCGAWLARRFANGRRAFDEVWDIAKYVVTAGLFAPVLSASIGVTSLSVGGFAPWSQYQSIWTTWWLGDVVSNFVVAPFLATWSVRPRGGASPRRILEAAGLVAAVVAVAQVVFGGWLPLSAQAYPLEYLGIPVLLWAVFRFGQRGGTGVVLAFSALAIWGTLQGYGPFAGEEPNEGLLLLQGFMGTMALTAMVVAAVVSARRNMERALVRANTSLRLEMQERERAEQAKELLTDQLRGHRQRLNDILEQIPGVVWELCRSPETGELKVGFVSRFAETMLGYPVQRWFEPGFWQRLVHPEDCDRVESLLDTMTVGGRGGICEFRCTAQDGRLVWVELRTAAFQDETGKPLGLRSVAMDITDRKQMEGRLAASLAEKEVLLREIHHRVKNNLQVVSSLLGLQCDDVRHPETLMMFRECENRIRSMALVHEKLYRSENLSSIDLAEYLESLVEQIRASYRLAANIEVRVRAEAVWVGLDTAIPCALITNELVANALEHAFPGGRGGTVRVDVRFRQDHILSLEVADDGVGLAPGLDISHAETLGLRLVGALLQQLGATMQVVRARGTAFRVTIPAAGFENERPGSSARAREPAALTSADAGRAAGAG